MKTKKKNKSSEFDNIINFFFEVGYLNYIKRNQLKHDNYSISGHSFRVAIISYSLAKIEKADIQKVVLMSLFHDLPETRTGDADLMNKCYLEIFEEKAIKDMVKKVPFGKEIKDILKELWLSKTKEAKIVHDADILEELLTEKEQLDRGNKNASLWMNFSINRLSTRNGKVLGKKIITHNSYSWWHGTINRNYLEKK